MIKKSADHIAIAPAHGDDPRPVGESHGKNGQDSVGVRPYHREGVKGVRFDDNQTAPHGADKQEPIGVRQAANGALFVPVCLVDSDGVETLGHGNQSVAVQSMHDVRLD